MTDNTEDNTGYFTERTGNPSVAAPARTTREIALHRKIAKAFRQGEDVDKRFTKAEMRNYYDYLGEIARGRQLCPGDVLGPIQNKDIQNKHGGKIKKTPANRYARGGKAYTYGGGFRKTK